MPISSLVSTKIGLSVLSKVEEEGSLRVRLDSGTHNWATKRPDVWREIRQEAVKYGWQNGLHARLRGRWNAQESEMPHKSGSDGLTASTGRRAGSADGCVLDVFPEKLLSIIEALQVLELPQKLHWGLCTVRLLGGHVHIIHKEYDSLVDRGSKSDIGKTKCYPLPYRGISHCQTCGSQDAALYEQRNWRRERWLQFAKCSLQFDVVKFIV